MNIRRLLRTRDWLNDKIDLRVKEFLAKLHDAGEFAPTVTRQFGGGTNSIDEINLDGPDGTIRIECSNVWRGEKRRFHLDFPADLIDSLDDNAIKAYAAEQRRQREASKAAQQAAKDAERKAEELETLNRLQAKYAPQQ